MWRNRRRSLRTLIGLVLTLGPISPAALAGDPAPATTTKPAPDDVPAAAGGFVMFKPEGSNPFGFAASFGDDRGVEVAESAHLKRSSGADVEAARWHFRRGDVRAALRSVDEASRTQPDDPELRQVRALALFTLGRFEEAGREARIVMDGGASWDWAAARGFFANPDDYLRHLGLLKRVARQRKGSAEVQWLLAYHCFLRGQGDAGRDALRMVSRTQADDMLARELLAGMSLNLGRGTRPLSSR